MSAHVRIGSATVISLSDTEQPYPATTVYHEAGDALSGYAGLLTEAGEVLLNFACFVIQADGRTVLVDTGWGPGYQGRLLDELDGAGIRPEAIDAVIFTHLHGDHIGWNIVQDSRKQPSWSNLEMVVPWGDLVLIFVLVYAVALLTTLAPALRASRIAPAEALRYE